MYGIAVRPSMMAARAYCSLVKNYTGDVLNFETAQSSCCNGDGVKVDFSLIDDDVAVKSQPLYRRSPWRCHYRAMRETGGAAAETGYDLSPLRRRWLAHQQPELHHWRRHACLRNSALPLAKASFTSGGQRMGVWRGHPR